MKKWTHILRRKEFRAFFFPVSLMFFIGPFFRPDLLERPGALYAYLFLVWIAVIFVLFLMSRGSGAPASIQSGKPERGADTDV
ncbi:MAG: hypothetical protein GY859_40590 [Desulfobacterales bacterium]|nr:hypothetical protein [Desulfobacterales bacterium]